nr:MAG TPA: hypothetical protein [Caudoviricetes sp.]
MTTSGKVLVELGNSVTLWGEMPHNKASQDVVKHRYGIRTALI